MVVGFKHPGKKMRDPQAPLYDFLLDHTDYFPFSVWTAGVMLWAVPEAADCAPLVVDMLPDDHRFRDAAPELSI